jgi:hypothetical protein
MSRFTAVLGTLALAAQLYAGGLYLTLGSPDASAEAKAANAVVTARVSGCHNPEDAKVTAVAIGIVDGRRETVQLKLAPLSVPGMYALARQWPAQGRWVIQLTAERGGIATVLVPAGPDGVDRYAAKRMNGRPPAADIDAMLNGGHDSVARR